LAEAACRLLDDFYLLSGQANTLPIPKHQSCLLSFPLFFFCALGTPAICKAPDRTCGLPASQEIPRHLD